MNLYQHFRKEEHAFIDQVLEWKQTVENQYSPKLTDFLDPREQEIVKQVIGTNGEILVDFFGGKDGLERKRALLYPTYFEPNEDDYHLAFFEVKYPVKFVTVDHRKVLGSLMSLGLKRTKFGDILTQDEQIQIVVANEIADYVRMNLTAVGKATISLSEINSTDLLEVNEEWTEQTVTVSSLRLDVVLSSILNLSRQKVQVLIENGLVKVNWKKIEQTSFECKETDVLSVRGYGRSKLHSIEGKTKKEKWRIIVGRQK
ncbi:RNA-binding protein [Bacillus timonensis]|uniref:RNA-binding protein n=1 Tax=Bacillus timonensis TaxID=1033734 RepID=A0A4S3PX07_9BACI|nr:RNA-binding protein [Bacillus timonensis]THE14401.1 RNA-binding protein [Bacillus timonensis]